MFAKEIIFFLGKKFPFNPEATIFAKENEGQGEDLGGQFFLG